MENNLLSILKDEPAVVRELGDLLFSGIEERPMWDSFLIALSRCLGAGPAAFIIQGAELPIADSALLIASIHDLTDHQHLLAAGILQGTPFDQPLAIPCVGGQQYGHWCVMRISIHGKHQRSVWLVVPHNGQAATGWEGIFTALLPILQRVVPLYVVIGDMERRLRVAEHILETSGVGMILVDGRSHVLDLNETARALLNDTPGIMIRDGILMTDHAGSGSTLKEAISAMAERQSRERDDSCYVSVALDRDDRVLPLTLIVRPGPPFGPVSAPSRRTAVVVLRDPARRAVLAAPDLEQLFALSRAEARLAGILADGQNLEDAAAELGISRNTARAQLQAIFGKTGTNRQADLVRLLLTSVASLTKGRQPQ